MDLGYTDHVEALWGFFDAAIERALDLIDETADHPPEAQFRYTCEVTCIVEHFLAHAPPRQVDRLIRAERNGRLDVGGMWAHFTPLMDRGAMSWTMDRAARLREEHGLAIRSAMDCDINGLPWPWVDAFLDGGINGFTMSINEHRGRSPTRPRAWWWQGPSGRKILTWCGENYNWGRWYGVPQDIDQAEAEFAQYLWRLEENAYPYSFAYLQSTGELNWGDNNWPSEHLSDFVRTWNERGNTPRFEIVTLSGFLDALRGRLGDDVPTIRGDWCDWWAFGVASMPRHTALLRQTQEKLALCHRLMARFDNEPKVESWRHQLDRASQRAALFCEHTFCSDEAATRPDSSFTDAAIGRKAGYVLDAATIVEQVYQQIGGVIRGGLGVSGGEAVVLNPFDEPSTATLRLSSSYASPKAKNPPQMCPQDAARAVEDGFESPRLTLAPNETRRVENQRAQQIAWRPHEGDLVLESDRARIEFDSLTGAVTKWSNVAGASAASGALKRLGGHGLNAYVLESVAGDRVATWRFYDGWQPHGWGQHGSPDALHRAVPTRVLSSERGDVHDRTMLRLHLEAPGVEDLSLAYELHSDGLGLDIVNRMVLLGDTAPRSIYFVFEAAMKGGVFWYDAAGAPTRNDHQVPGSCHDYVSIGQWAAISGSPQSMLLLSPDVPMLQPGGFNYLQLRKQPPAVLDAPMLVSWPVNNHKEVNFPVRQTGVLVLRYTVRIGPAEATSDWLCQEAQRLSRSWCWLPYVRWEEPRSSSRHRVE